MPSFIFCLVKILSPCPFGSICPRSPLKVHRIGSFGTNDRRIVAHVCSKFRAGICCTAGKIRSRTNQCVGIHEIWPKFLIILKNHSLLGLERLQNRDLPLFLLRTSMEKRKKLKRRWHLLLRPRLPLKYLKHSRISIFNPSSKSWKIVRIDSNQSSETGLIKMYRTRHSDFDKRKT